MMARKEVREDLVLFLDSDILMIYMYERCNC